VIKKYKINFYVSREVLHLIEALREKSDIAVGNHEYREIRDRTTKSKVDLFCDIASYQKQANLLRKRQTCRVNPSGTWSMVTARDFTWISG
jgi:hypothetical protein